MRGHSCLTGRLRPSLAICEGKKKNKNGHVNKIWVGGVGGVGERNGHGGRVWRHCRLCHRLGYLYRHPRQWLCVVAGVDIGLIRGSSIRLWMSGGIGTLGKLPRRCLRSLSLCVALHCCIRSTGHMKPERRLDCDRCSLRSSCWSILQ